MLYNDYGSSRLIGGAVANGFGPWNLTVNEAAPLHANGYPAPPAYVDALCLGDSHPAGTDLDEMQLVGRDAPVLLARGHP